MPFRDVEPDPGEPAPATLGWLARPMFVLGALLVLLPAAFLVLTTTVRWQDRPEPIVIDTPGEVVAAADAEREARRNEARARLEQRRLERELSDPLHDCATPSDEPVRLDLGLE